jgi:hypothetical protein
VFSKTFIMCVKSTPGNGFVLKDWTGIHFLVVFLHFFRFAHPSPAVSKVATELATSRRHCRWLLARCKGFCVPLGCIPPILGPAFFLFSFYPSFLFIPGSLLLLGLWRGNLARCCIRECRVFLNSHTSLLGSLDCVYQVSNGSLNFQKTTKCSPLCIPA